jgi:hypothetical protein
MVAKKRIWILCVYATVVVGPFTVIYALSGLVCICIENRDEHAINVTVELPGKVIKYRNIKAGEEMCKAGRVERDGALVCAVGTNKRGLYYVYSKVA